MKNVRFCLLAILLALELATEAPAQQAAPGPKADLAGTLLDPNTGRPVVGVKLALVDPGEYTTTTNSAGRFVFLRAPEATYRYLFVFERGDRKLQGSMLLKKGVEVSRLGALPLSLRRQTVRELPEERLPRLAKLRFRDARKRRHKSPIMLRESLDLDWPEQYFAIKVGFGSRRCREASLRVMNGSTGDEVPFQLSDVERSRGGYVRSGTLTFPASLKRLEWKAYQMCSDSDEGFAPPNYETDLKVETRKNTGERILSNSFIAVRLPPAKSDKALPAEKCPAPILAVRGADGVWFGQGRLVSKREVKSYKCEETETGPLFREFQVTYTFAEEKGKEPEDTKPGGEYQVTIRVFAKRDYVVIQERMKGDLDLAFRFSLSANFKPGTAMFIRDGDAAFEKLPDVPAQGPSTLAIFRAWNPRGLRNSHNWYGVASSGNRKDAVGLVQVNGDRWAFEGRERWGDGSWLITSRDDEQVRLVATKKPDLYLEFPYRTGTRTFALVIFNKDQNWDPASLASKALTKVKSHHLNRLHVRLSQMDLLKMMAVRAESAKRFEQPRLLFNSQTFAKLKEVFDKDPGRFPPVLHDVFSGSRIRTTAIRAHIFSGVFALRQAFLGRPGEKRLTGLCAGTTHPALIEPIVRYTTLLYDANSSSGLFSDREKAVILGTFAFVAAQLESLAYMPLYADDPEATAQRDTALTLISLLLDRHPQSSTRLLRARGSMLSQLAKTSATSGVPLSVGPVLRAMNVWAETAPTLDAAWRPTAIGDSPFQWPAFIGTLGRLTMLTTPPDKRYGGTRLLPALGRSRSGDREILAIMGQAATKLAKTGPKFAGRLAWAWEQAGRPTFGQRTRHSALLSVLELIPSDTEAEAPEKAESSPLPGFGALLRADFRGPDEAYLLFKCSRLPYSFHHDQGSLLFYALGTPLLVDTGSSPRRQATWAHNTVRIDSRTHSAPGRLLEFINQDDDDYVVGEIKVEALSKLKEYTKTELDAARAAAAKKKPFVLPPGHLPDGGQTADMLAAPEKLEEPVFIRRHVLFNRVRQYAVVLDRIQGRLPTDVFYNVLAKQARVQGQTATFAGPFGVDLDIHAFGTNKVQAGVHKDITGCWTLRLSQPAPPAEKKKEPETPTPNKDDKKTDDEKKDDAKKGDEKKDDKKVEEAEPEPPTVEYLTVLCPIRRATPDGAKVKEQAAPKVESLKGISGVRISYGKTIRYIFLAEKEAEYNDGQAQFKGRRGILTIRPTHFDVVLFDAGEMRYKGRGVKTNYGVVRFRLAPGGYVDGEVAGPRDKRLTFYGLGRSPRYLLYKVDKMEYNGDGDSKTAQYGVVLGSHAISIEPR